MGNFSLSTDSAKSGSAQSDTEIIVLSFILGVFCVVGTVGNALVFIIYYRKREKGTSTIFILSLAVIDFLTCLINIPYTITAFLLNYKLEYDVVCVVFMYISTFNVPLSAMMLVAIGIDRYLCICHPFLHVVTVPRAKACVIVLTIIAALLGIVPALSHRIYRVDENSTASRFASNFSEDSIAKSSAREFSNGLLLEPAAYFVNDFRRTGLDYDFRNNTTGEMSYATFAATSLLNDVIRTTSTTTTLSPATTATRLQVRNSSSDEADFDGMCVESDYIVSFEFVKGIYQKIYAGTFLFEFIILALLYGLIYRSILVRRAWKTKRKRLSCHVSTNCPETVTEETQLSNLNGGGLETVVVKKNPGRFSSAMRDRTLHANIKTAAMLFVVTVAFVVSFLPSWLMGLQVFDFQITIFYLFYVNNAINPVIYAFMNRTFRDDLFQLLKNIFPR